jgi:hypothetical protein
MFISLNVHQLEGRAARSIAPVTVALPALATESGRPVYPQGLETLAAGALPPPGWYAMLNGTHYTASRVNSSSGNHLQVPGL